MTAIGPYCGRLPQGRARPFPNLRSLAAFKSPQTIAATLGGQIEHGLSTQSRHQGGHARYGVSCYVALLRGSIEDWRGPQIGGWIRDRGRATSMLRRSSRWMPSRQTAIHQEGPGPAGATRHHVLRRPGQEGALRHRVLRRAGNAERARPYHLNSDDRVGLYRASEVVQAIRHAAVRGRSVGGQLVADGEPEACFRQPSAK